MAEKCFPTLQELRGFGIDADIWRKFINGEVDEVNLNRNGIDVETLLTWKEQVMEIARQAANMQTYLTKAEMEAAGPQPKGTVAQVTNDPDPANNGYWVSDGSQWIWSGVQPADAARFNALDALVVNKGKRLPMLILNRGGITSLPNPIVDDFLLSAVVVGRSDLIEGRYFRIGYIQNGVELTHGSNNGIRLEESFFDEFESAGIVRNVHETSDTPASYDRAKGGIQTFSVQAALSPGLTFIITVDVDKMPPPGTPVQMGETTSRYYSGVIHPNCYIPIQDDVHADWFSNDGFYINAGNGNNLVASQPPSATTEFISLRDVEGIEVFGRSSSLVALVAFYDAGQRFLSSISGVDKHRKKIFIPKSEFPDGAEFIRSTGLNNTGSSHLRIHTEKNVSDALQRLYKDRGDLSSLFKFDAYWRPSSSTPYPNPNYAYTDPIPVKVGYKFFAATSVVSTTEIENPAYDANLNKIGQFDVLSPNFEVTQDVWDAGVRYVAFSFRPNDRKILTCDQAAEDLTARVMAIEERIKGGSGSSEVLGISGITLIGASLAYSGNAWFGKSTAQLGVVGINKAISGALPYEFGNSFWRDTLWTAQEFEDADVLAVQFASSRDLDDEADLMPTYEDYTANFDINVPGNPFRDNYTHAQTVDYILKKWQALCYEQRNVAGSKWYGTQHGKPCRIMFVSHWHDARSYYNDAIRVLAKRWGAQICPFDEKIGFSKNQPLQNGQQVSRLYAQDTQTIDSVVYGWHPLRGLEGEYIQSKMAGIFVTAIRDCFQMGS